jgi:hypothetical protein
MDQRADHIRQDIDATRAALDAKLDSLETKARQTFDLNHQVGERPWMALGAAVAAGYVLGSLGNDEPEQNWHGLPATSNGATQQSFDTTAKPSNGDRFLAPFDAEIALLKTAAVTTLTNFLHDVIKEYVPALGEQFKSAVQDGLASPSNSSGSYDEHAVRTPTRQADSQTLTDLLTDTPAIAERERGVGTNSTRY